MTGLSHPRLWPWAFAVALCAVAAAAVSLTVPVVRNDPRSAAAGSEPLAPQLAALGDDQLAELLPARRDFPPGWTVRARREAFEYFGYYTTQPADGGLGVRPAECFAVIGGVASGEPAAVEVSGHDPADPPIHSDRRDIRLRIGREYNPAGFDDLIELVTRCQRFSSSIGPRLTLTYTVKILENGRTSGGPQRLRYSLTTQVGTPGRSTRTEDFYSYARTSALVLSGAGSNGHQEVFDAAFARVLSKIRTAGR